MPLTSLFSPGKSIGGSPVSPGIGQDDPSVYFDATESAALHLETSNNNQDVSQSFHLLAVL